MTSMPAATTAASTSHLLRLQHDDGRWEGEMVWNTMLLSQYVLTHRMLEHWPLRGSDVRAVRKHYEVTQLPDGSWPFHPDSGGSVDVTALAYVTLRVLGVLADDPLVARTRGWMAAQPGGVLAIPSWGRMWLALAGLYDYRGVTSIPAELVMLPRAFPLHPYRLGCHTRYAYFGMAWLQGRKARFDLGEALTIRLREELFGDYASVDFGRARGRDGEVQALVPSNPVLRFVNRVLPIYERSPLRRLRNAALRRCADRLVDDLLASQGQGLSPVTSLLACLVMALDGVPREAVHAALDALNVWEWKDELEGLRVVGQRSSAWDTSFALRALLSLPPSPAVVPAIGAAYHWLCDAQLEQELDESVRTGRDGVAGGWCFSDGGHRWPVSDCTAEALSALLLIHDRPDLSKALVRRLPDSRIHQAVGFVLARQNADGGFGAYERERAPKGAARLRLSDMYVDCATDHSHVECTASCVAALARFASRYPDHCSAEIEASIGSGVDFLVRQQRSDGAYPAAWGINFTYSAFFVVEALITAGVDRTHPGVAGVIDWLVDHQKTDGGWGEHCSSVLAGRYVEHPESQAAMTAWALLALMRAGGQPQAVRRGVAFLTALRSADGGWPRQSASGVLFGTVALDYRLYRDIFPAWAIGVAAGSGLA